MLPHKAHKLGLAPPKMSSKKVVDTKTQTSTKTTTEADGTIVEVTTTTITEKYEDGSSGTRTETKTVKKPPGAKPSDGHKNGVQTQYLNPDLTPENSTAAKVENTTDPGFIQECLQAHNKLRAKHGSLPLTLDPELNKISQAWANELAKKGSMQHNTTGFGENVYWNTELPPGSRPAEAWYSEIKDFNFKKIEGQKGTGHFTQLVWKTSALVGIAMKQGAKGFFVVANYHPPGNIVGKFPDNVQKPL